VSFLDPRLKRKGPGVYSLAVRVADNGAPSLSATQNVTITVNEVNSPPVLGTIGNKTVNELALLMFTATATDSDVPGNSLSFSLDPGAPAEQAWILPAACLLGPRLKSRGLAPIQSPFVSRTTDHLL